MRIEPVGFNGINEHKGQSTTVGLGGLAIGRFTQRLAKEKAGCILELLVLVSQGGADQGRRVRGPGLQNRRVHYVPSRGVLLYALGIHQQLRDAREKALQHKKELPHLFKGAIFRP